jgi:hypothetical protein
MMIVIPIPMAVVEHVDRGFPEETEFLGVRVQAFGRPFFAYASKPANRAASIARFGIAFGARRSRRFGFSRDP